MLFLYAGVILIIVLLYGWYFNNGDVTYGRLLGDPDTHGFTNPRYKNPVDIKGFGWPFLIPPVILLIITRLGIPVSTSFMILTFFNPENLYDMVVKSVSGYLVAFGAAVIIYIMIARVLEKKFGETSPTEKEFRYWSVAQWFSTGFLWSQWLIQDFANIYVYLPRQLSFNVLLFTIGVFLVLLALIFYSKGGAIQAIVKAKRNVRDVRSATIVDLIYGLVLLFFKEINNIPMSTTWVFIGLLAGRELAINYFVSGSIKNHTLVDLGKDLGKVFLGLGISIVLVFLVRYLTI